MKRKNTLPKRAILKNFFCAFSLVEMLMALLVASLLLAALAPVITKRINNETVNVLGAGVKPLAAGDMRCWYPGHPNMVNAADGSNTQTLPDEQLFSFENINTYRDVASVIIVSAGGGGGGAMDPQPKPDTYSTDGGEGLLITSDMDEFVISEMKGGGGGGGGGAGQYAMKKFTANATDCKNYGNGRKDTRGNTGAEFATYDSVNKLCVTKYNQIAKGTPGSGIGCWTTYSHSSCNSNQNQMAYAYSGCQRAVCTWQGAVNACNYLNETAGEEITTEHKGWVLPTTGQLANWKDAVSWKELALCASYSTNTTVAWCDKGGVPSDSSHIAQAYDIWSSTSYNCSYLYASWGDYNACGNEGPRTVRCVLASSLVEKFTPFPGGQGGSSPSITNMSSTTPAVKTLNDRIKANPGGRIILTYGKGGAGATALASTQKGVDGNAGTAGGESCITVRSKAGVDVYKICVPGGNAGGGGKAELTDTTGGKGNGDAGAAKAADSCYYVDYTVSTVSQTFNCTAGGAAGATGDAAISEANKNGSTPHAANQTVLGTGGMGGYATKTDNALGGEAILNFGKGGDGAKGAIVISYVHKYEGKGGGGGGGGYVAHLKNVIKTASGPSCKIRVGLGGAGAGAAGGDGYAGGYSSVQCDDNNNWELLVLGGEGGYGAKRNPANNSEVTLGEGGAKGKFQQGPIYNNLIKEDGNTGKIFERKEGSDGKAGGSINSEIVDNYKQGIRSSGGRGGTSGTGSYGTCGGLYNEPSAQCNMVSVDKNNDIVVFPLQTELNGIAAGEIEYPRKETFNIDEPNFGNAGAGGGGGAWHMGLNPGTGGRGQDGYVCIYWNDPPSTSRE